MTSKNPKVFISYSHDNQEHQDRVLELSNKLRSQGIDCILDQYEESPPEGWPRWMAKNIKISDYILMVCTESYYNRVMGNEEKGLGVKWEGHLIYQDLYNAGAINNKFIPIRFSEGNVKFIPEPLQGSTYYNVDNKTDFDKLYWRLRGIKTKKPELGELRELPAKERRTIFVSGLIDVDLWNKAGWKGVAYVQDKENREPPYLCLLFSDKEIAIKIFQNLQKRLGEFDSYNELRVSIVEGDVKDKPYGYFVHIDSDAENFVKRIESKRKDIKLDLIMLVGRVHRMNPSPNSQNLNAFKNQFKLFNSFSLAPGVLYPDNKVEIIRQIRILKKNIEFRQYKDIVSLNDPDACLNDDFVKEYENV